MENQGEEIEKTERRVMGNGGIRVFDPVDVWGEEIEKGFDDHERDWGNLGPITGCGESNQSEKEENSNLDLNVEHMDLDLNFPAAMEIEEEGGGKEETSVLDIIQISSDDEQEGFVSVNDGGGRRTYTREEKGKAKLQLDDSSPSPWLSLSTNSMMQTDSIPERQIDLSKPADFVGMQRLCEVSQLWESQLWETEDMLQLFESEPRETTSARKEEPVFVNVYEPPYKPLKTGKQRNHEIAREHAHRWARFDSHLEQEGQMQPLEADKNLEKFVGPFSTSMEVVKDRNRKHSSDQEMINWKPLTGRDCSNVSMPFVPSLVDLSMRVLAKNTEAVVSLEYVPDALKYRLTDMLCDSRKLDARALELLLEGTPTEIRIKDCSWMTEEQFTKLFRSFDTKNLKVLQLNLCGQCVLGASLGKIFARSPNSLPDLAIISLKGACRLTDDALKILVESAPAIQSINLSQCSLLTSNCIYVLADSLADILRELYIDNCQRIDVMLIAPAIKNFKYLEVLSIAGMETVCDEFLIDIITERGRNMKELDLADCLKLTNISMEVIGSTCSRLCSLNISNLHNLTDLAIQYIANGCQSIQTLKLRRNSFSDEALAAFFETSGKSLKQLSLNNVRMVGPNTALSLAKCSKELLSLDLSWCRKITNEALGLIVDSCLSLKLLKLFGCTQISDEFLKGHSNSQVRIIGLNTTPLLEHLNVLETEVAYLRYSPLTKLSSDSQSSGH